MTTTNKVGEGGRVSGWDNDRELGNLVTGVQGNIWPQAKATVYKNIMMKSERWPDNNKKKVDQTNKLPNKE